LGISKALAVECRGLNDLCRRYGLERQMCRIEDRTAVTQSLGPVRSQLRQVRDGRVRHRRRDAGEPRRFDARPCVVVPEAQANRSKLRVRLPGQPVPNVGLTMEKRVLPTLDDSRVCRRDALRLRSRSRATRATAEIARMVVVLSDEQVRLSQGDAAGQQATAYFGRATLVTDLQSVYGAGLAGGSGAPRQTPERLG
jgi:hypothetical protein